MLPQHCGARIWKGYNKDESSLSKTSEPKLRGLKAGVTYSLGTCGRWNVCNPRYWYLEALISMERYYNTMTWKLWREIEFGWGLWVRTSHWDWCPWEKGERVEQKVHSTAKGDHRQARRRPSADTRSPSTLILNSQAPKTVLSVLFCSHRWYFCHSSPNGWRQTGERTLYWCSVPTLEWPGCVPTCDLSMQPRLPCSTLAWDWRPGCYN